MSETQEVIDKLRRYLDEKLGLEPDTAYFITKALNEHYWEEISLGDDDVDDEDDVGDEFDDFEEPAQEKKSHKVVDQAKEKEKVYLDDSPDVEDLPEPVKPLPKKVFNRPRVSRR